MEKIPFLLTEILYKERMIDEDDFEICKYGIQISMANLFNFFIAFGMGIIFHAVSEIGIFYVVFVTLRFFCGGYHSDSYGKCFSLFALTCLVYIAMVEGIVIFIESSGILLAAVLLMLGICILVKAPIEHDNRPFEEKERKHFRKRSIQIYLLWSVVGIVLCALRAERLSAGLTSVFIIILVYMMKGRRGRHEKEIA